jgi:hypothetical protein
MIITPLRITAWARLLHAAYGWYWKRFGPRKLVLFAHTAVPVQKVARHPIPQPVSTETRERILATLIQLDARRALLGRAR